jgi:hypothetical protein
LLHLFVHDALGRVDATIGKSVSVTSSIQVSRGRIPILLLLLAIKGRGADISPLIIRPPHLHKVLHKLSNLVIIDTNQLGMIRRSQIQPGDETEYFGDGSGDDKDVGAASADVGELNVELFVVFVEEPPLDGGVDAVEGDDGVGGEEPVEEETDDTCDGVFCEQIECVIDANNVLDCKALDFNLKVNREMGLLFVA